MTSLKSKLNDVIEYLKTTFKKIVWMKKAHVLITVDVLSWSDSGDKDFQKQCSHLSHHMACKRCNELRLVVDKIEDSIKNHASSLYSKEQRDDLLYDL